MDKRCLVPRDAQGQVRIGINGTCHTLSRHQRELLSNQPTTRYATYYY